MSQIKVEVAYALPEKQSIIVLEVEQGTTALQAALASNISSQFQGLDVENARMGIFGKAVDASKYELRQGDRVEIYRPLLIDPKANRKARAAKLKDTND